MKRENANAVLMQLKNISSNISEISMTDRPSGYDVIEERKHAKIIDDALHYIHKATTIIKTEALWDGNEFLNTKENDLLGILNQENDTKRVLNLGKILVDHFGLTPQEVTEISNQSYDTSLRYLADKAAQGAQLFKNDDLPVDPDHTSPRNTKG